MQGGTICKGHGGTHKSTRLLEMATLFSVGELTQTIPFEMCIYITTVFIYADATPSSPQW